MNLSGGSGIDRSAGPGGDGVRTMERGGAAGPWQAWGGESQDAAYWRSPFPLIGSFGIWLLESFWVTVV
jgi:hypothetical protein